MERDQNVARENVRRLTRLRGWSLKELAEAAGLSASSVYNWSKTNEPNELGPKAINAIAEALEVLPEHLFYNPPHEQAGAPPQAPEDWREQIREIERYVRSIESPAERLATVKRLLAIAKTDVEVWERSLDERTSAGRAGDSPKPAPGTNRGRHGRPVS